MPSSVPLTVIAIFKALPGKHTALRAAQEIMVAETLQENGCLRYELNQSLDDPHILIITETWANEDAWNAHMKGSAIQHFQESGCRDLAAEFSVHRMTMVAG